jgi:peroxiredoxin
MIKSELQPFQKLVIANALNAKGLNIGDTAPDFILPNTHGKPVSLSMALKEGIVIIKFYRGEWCPICNLDLREIQQHIQKIKSLGANVLAISPQKPDDALVISMKNELGFEVLSDEDQNVIQAYQLQFDPGEDYHKRRDLTRLNGNALKTLPVPATFVIGPNRKIIARHVEADYTQRLSAQEIIDVLKGIRMV